MTSARTVIGPLTTTFTAPGYCNNVVVACPYSCSYGWQAQECVSGGGYTYEAEDATSCWPPASSRAPTPTAPFGGWGFYSPGLICPSGYASACSATASGSSGWIVEYSMTKGETAVGCCPSGYVCGGNNEAQTCSSLVYSGQTVPVITCSEGTSQGYTYLTLPVTETKTGISSSTARVGEFAITSFEVFAPMIEIRWQSSDLPTSSSTPTHTQPKNTSTNTAASSSGLSTGAKAAIGVVVPVAVIAILAGIFFFWRRKIRKLDSSQWPAPSSTASATQSGFQPSSGQDLPMETRSYYKSADNRGSYMSSPRELDASPHPQELEGSKMERSANG